MPRRRRCRQCAAPPAACRGPAPSRRRCGGGGARGRGAARRLPGAGLAVAAETVEMRDVVRGVAALDLRALAVAGLARAHAAHDVDGVFDADLEALEEIRCQVIADRAERRGIAEAAPRRLPLKLHRLRIITQK